MGVAVDVGHVAERLQDLVDLPPVPRPEVPRRVVFVERRVGEHHHGLALRPVRQRLVEPAPLGLTHARPGAGDAAIERGHVPHPLLGRHLLGAPVVGSVPDRVETDEAHALVIEGPRALPERLLPLGAQVQVPVVLPGNEDLLDRELLEDVGAEGQLHRVPELGKVSPEDQEVRRRTHGLDLLHRPDRLLDEPGVHALGVEVGVGEPGELEGGLLAEGQVDGVDGREPSHGRGPGRGAGQDGLVDEGPAGDREGAVGPLPSVDLHVDLPWIQIRLPRFHSWFLPVVRQRAGPPPGVTS